MDINHFINILQQNTETIKQLKQQIDNLETKVEVQNKTINELLFEGGEIFGHSFDAVHMITDDNRHNSNNVILKKHQLEIIISLLQHFKYLTYIKILSFCYENLTVSNVSSTSIQNLTIQPKYIMDCGNNYVLTNNHNAYNENINYNRVHNTYVLEFTLNGIHNLPNLTYLTIYMGYGLYNFVETLSSVPHKIKDIYLYNCFDAYDSTSMNKKQQITQYCNTNNIVLRIEDDRITNFANNLGTIKYLKANDEMFAEK